jgi:hypothetical protein
MLVPTIRKLTMRLTSLFFATCLAAAVLAPVGFAEDAPPSTGGVTAGAERSADEKPKKENHGSKVRECAKAQKTDKRTGGGHGERVKACAKKLREARSEKREQRSEKKERAKERMEQCRALQKEMHAAVEELKSEFRARAEALKDLPRDEYGAAMRALKAEYEQATKELREEFASKHEQCKDLKERAEEHHGEGKARP